MSARILEILRDDPAVELAQVERALIRRYGFERRLVGERAAAALAQARRSRINRIVAHQVRPGPALRLAVTGKAT